MSQHVTTSYAIADRGPQYAETDPSVFPVDAWSTWSNLVFGFVLVYWFLRLRGQWRRHMVLTLSLPLLAVGWIGGTVYHATRSHDLWLFMDWMPIVILILLAAYWLWRRLLPSTKLGVLVALAAMLLPLFLSALLAVFLVRTQRSGISFSYAVLASGVVVPAVLHCMRQRGLWPWFLVVLACFAAALFFRAADWRLDAAGWPHGSHYLWHLFGGFATFFMFSFLYRLGTEPRRSR